VWLDFGRLPGVNGVNPVDGLHLALVTHIAPCEWFAEAYNAN
jgi:hypothetical protein